MSEQAAQLDARLASGSDLAWLRADRPFGGAPRLDRGWVAARAFSDVVLLTIAILLSGIAGGEALGAWSAVAFAATLAGFSASGLYLPRLRLQLLDEVRRLLAVSALVSLSVAGIALTISGRAGIGDVTVVHWLVASTLVSGGRLGLYSAQRAARKHGAGGRRTLVVGAGRVGHLIAKRMLDDPQLGLRPIGFLDKEPLPVSGTVREITDVPGLPVLGASWDLEDVIATHRIEQIVVAFSTAPHTVMLDLVRRCWTLGVGVMVVPRLYEVEGRRFEVEHLGALPLVALRSTDPLSWQFTVKYALDRLAAVVMVLLLAPALCLIAAAVLVSMGRPIFFRQRRIGRDGREFEMLKFRTMRGEPAIAGEADERWAELILADTGIDPDTVTTTAPRQNRCTPLGAVLRKLSLDELPQLWNVVRGEMSLVGPRPERAHYAKRFENAVYRYPDRHRVKSGLTGWAQVHGLRGETSLQDRIEWDNFYIENWSPWLDLQILLRTFPALVGRRRGA